MKPFNLIPVPGNADGKTCDSIRIENGRDALATVWRDGSITFNPKIDYFYEEVEAFLKIGYMFSTFFNNIKSPESVLSDYEV